MVFSTSCSPATQSICPAAAQETEFPELTVIGYLRVEDIEPSACTLMNTRKSEVERIRTLGMCRQMKNLPQLENGLHHAEVDVRRMAARALGWLRHPDTAPALIKALKDPDEHTRRWAAASLALAQNQTADSALRCSLRRDTHGSVRASAARSLGWLDLEGAKHTLRNAFFADEDANVRTACLEALVRLNALDDEDLLRAALKDHAASVRTQAVRALSAKNDAMSSESLLRCLEDHDPHVRIVCLRGLVARHVDSAEHACIKALQDQNPGVRVAAVVGLRHLNAPHIHSVLEVALKDQHPEVRYHAQQAIDASRASPKTGDPHWSSTSS